jgi:hypothetical protein
MLYQRLIHHLDIARRVQRFDYEEIVDLEADAEPFSLAIGGFRRAAARKDKRTRVLIHFGSLKITEG